MAFTFNIPPVTTLPLRPGTRVTLDKMIFLISLILKRGLNDLNKAAAPATWGAAMEVPFIFVYLPRKSVLKILVPGAAMWTLLAPKFENDARALFGLSAATEIILLRL